MDTDTYDVLTLPGDEIWDVLNYLKENMNVKIMCYGNETLGIERCKTVDLAVKETEPGICGNTSSGGLKPATMETGLVV